MLPERFAAFRQWLRGRILSATGADEAIVLARIYGEFEHANWDGTYFDDEVEARVLALCEQPSGWDLEALRRDKGEDVLLVASELLDYGGHTPVVLKWLQLKPGGLRHKLAVTRSATQGVLQTVAQAGCEVTRCTGYDRHAVGQVLEAARGVGTIVLHIHPDDIVAAVAARVLQQAGRRVIFYNHADHCFSYGIRTADVVAEISHFGDAISRRTGRVRGSSCWLGIPVDIPALPVTAAAPASESSRMVLTSGSPLKFEPAGGLFYGDFVDGILAADASASVHLVGPTGSESWWTPVKARWGGRLVFHGFQPRAVYLQLLQEAAVVVDGFPLGGGTAFIEGVMAGKPCTGLAIAMSGYSPTDVLREHSVPALVERVARLLRGDAALVEQAREVRRMVETTLGLPAFARRIEGLYRGDTAGCVNPFERRAVVESDWYERRWREEGVIEVPAGGSLLHRPLRFRLEMFRRLLPAMRHVRSWNALHLLAGGLKQRLGG